MIIRIYFVSNITYTYCCAVVVYAKSGFITFNSSSFDETSLPVPVPILVPSRLPPCSSCAKIWTAEISCLRSSSTSPGPDRVYRIELGDSWGIGDRRTRIKFVLHWILYKMGDGHPLNLNQKWPFLDQWYPMVGWPKKTPWRLTMAHRHRVGIIWNKSLRGSESVWVCFDRAVLMIDWIAIKVTHIQTRTTKKYYKELEVIHCKNDQLFFDGPETQRMYQHGDMMTW